MNAKIFVWGTLALALAGCAGGAEMSVSQFQYDPYEGSGRAYERSVTVDSNRGLQTQTCRTQIQRRIGVFGPEYERGREVCEDEPRPAYRGEPIAPDDVPKSVYRSPDRSTLPSAAIPN
ncbi:hypothetical protein [Microvirga pudoricolor]|uniref:hypothetical protein n=1 Tax=Microvirga pudoricolor TaxID=2778729 RepID=UPI0019509C1F|nr:hypothetical protein [Microvirga pudoricolor]MBM6595992.1 hypothetical protein [Microvirga pudoricolor]